MGFMSLFVVSELIVVIFYPLDRGLFLYSNNGSNSCDTFEVGVSIERTLNPIVPEQKQKPSAIPTALKPFLLSASTISHSELTSFAYAIPLLRFQYDFVH